MSGMKEVKKVEGRERRRCAGERTRAQFHWVLPTQTIHPTQTT